MHLIWIIWMSIGLHHNFEVKQICYNSDKSYPKSASRHGKIPINNLQLEK